MDPGVSVSFFSQVKAMFEGCTWEEGSNKRPGLSVLSTSRISCCSCEAAFVNPLQKQSEVQGAWVEWRAGPAYQELPSLTLF